MPPDVYDLMNVPELRNRIPLLKSEWVRNYQRLIEHPSAPRWNTRCGDRITSEDLLFIDAFERGLRSQRSGITDQPGSEVQAFLNRMRSRSAYVQEALKDLHVESQFHSIKRMERKDLQGDLQNIIPFDEPVDRLVVNPTSGTTGQPILAPNHPKAVGCYIPLLLFALERHGVVPVLNSSSTAAIQICAQNKTITYATVHSQADGSGFAKINLNPADWRSGGHPQEFISSLAPEFLSGDPYSFLESIRNGIKVKTKALLTTALALNPEDRRKLEEWARCPVIDLYSMNESGPIAYSCPLNPESFHILPHDLFVEVAHDDGQPCAPGESGEILLTGGRNPFLPLLRYRTGDTAAMDFTPCACGDSTPRLTKLSSRRTVIFLGGSGERINPVDIARILRRFPVLQHRVKQFRDQSLEVSLRVDNIWTQLSQENLAAELRTLFGNDLPFQIRTDFDPAAGKSIPYERE